jgi:hypothetical protein
MPDATGEVPGQPAEQAKATVTTSQVMQAAKDNFAIVSAATAALGVTLATIFLASYLSVFDWHLLWFVQYTDIITSGLVALGVLGGSLTLLQVFATTVLDAAEKSGVKRSHWNIAGLIFVLLSALILIGMIRQGQQYFHIIFFGAAAISGGALLLIRNRDHHRARMAEGRSGYGRYVRRSIEYDLLWPMAGLFSQGNIRILPRCLSQRSNVERRKAGDRNVEAHCSTERWRAVCGPNC